MKVINDLLNINNMKIVQNTKWFSFSLDSILLANFVKLRNNMKIIDLCTGNAPIPLFLSSRTKNKIIGIELQHDIYLMAKESVKINELSDQIEIKNMDAAKVNEIYETDTFDLVTCNPPYFKNNTNSKKNDVKQKAIARHELYFNIEKLCIVSRKILKNNGKLAIVHRTERLSEIINCMINNNIEPKRLQFIYSFIDSKSNLVLIEGFKNGKPGIVVEKPIIVHNKNGNYTNEILNIFNGGSYEN